MDHGLPDVFRDVVDLSPLDRARYFEDHAVAERIRVDVESLIAFDTRDDRIIEPLDRVMLMAAGASELAPGARCGAYVLGRLLGQGGMGTVFLAERADGELRQTVAIKFVPTVLAPGAFRTRFLQERQILASLHHPGIARLVDAGHTAGGQPFLVMEFVDGVPVDQYAESLGLKERLKLLLRICDAIGYAHRNLVIHRDIKPSNILVDASGQPKLLDFGIARMLDDTADPAHTKERLLTPEYASPEQVRGSARTTATDVYSLGAVLYRLLTGRSPHATADGRAESIDTIICSRTPEAPSRLSPAVPRDLDFVVFKALRKEPDERYATVDALADDVRAVLESRPVRARSGNAWYWMRKFVRRRWLPVSAVVAIIASLAAGLYVANGERRTAEYRFGQLRQLANRLLTFDVTLRGLPGSIDARRQIVAASLDYLDGLGREARGDRSLAMELADGYLTLAQVQGVPTLSNLGQFDAANTSLQKADAFLQRLLAANPDDPNVLVRAAEVEQARMIIADTQRRDSEALAHTIRCGEYVERLMQSPRVTLALVREALPSLSNVGLSYMNRGHLDEALRYDRRSIDIARRVGDDNYLAQSLSLLANTLRLTGDVDAALPPIVEARRVAESIPFTSELRKNLYLYGILLRQGEILGADEGISLNRPAEAIEPLQRGLALVEQLASRDPNDVTSRDRVATVARQLADIVRHDDPRQALDIYDRAIERQREVKSSARARRAEAQLLANASYPARALGRLLDSRRRIDRAFELLRATGDYPATTIPARGEASSTLRALADHLADSGDTARAIDTYRALVDRIAASGPEQDLQQAFELSRIYASYARLLNRADKRQEAGEVAARRMNLWRAWEKKSPSNPVVRRALAADPLADRSP